jgi:F-type H+-transporting ATPase subunit delta
MSVSRVAYRFGKALLQLAIEKNVLEDILKDIQHINAACKENRDLRMMLRNPVIKVDKKRRIFHMLFDENLSKMSITFYDIIFRRSREELILDITESFIIQYKEFKKIHMVTVETAQPLSEENRKMVLEFLKSRTEDEIELIEKVNEDLVGGIVLRMNDLQIDASVRNNLNKLEKEFSKDLYSVKI